MLLVLRSIFVYCAVCSTAIGIQLLFGEVFDILKETIFPRYKDKIVWETKNENEYRNSYGCSFGFVRSNSIERTI